MKIGQEFPNFEAAAWPGPIEDFHKFIGNSWAVLFSHPADFNPISTTEMAAALVMFDDFTKRNVKLIALTRDSVETHAQWIKDILHYRYKGRLPSKNTTLPFPIISDIHFTLIDLFNIIDIDERDHLKRVLASRAVFFISPDKKLRAQIDYPAAVGRNFNEILRIVDALQVVNENVGTPVNWQLQDRVMISEHLSMDEVGDLFDEDVLILSTSSGKMNLRYTTAPPPKCFLKVPTTTPTAPITIRPSSSSTPFLSASRSLHDVEKLSTGRQNLSTGAKPTSLDDNHLHRTPRSQPVSISAGNDDFGALSRNGPTESLNNSGDSDVDECGSISDTPDSLGDAQQPEDPE